MRLLEDFFLSAAAPRETRVAAADCRRIERETERKSKLVIVFELVKSIRNGKLVVLK